MKRRTVAEGRELVTKFRASGESQARFAKRNRIRVAVLRYWLHRSKRKGIVHKEPVRFVELEPGADEPQVSIETEAAVVRLSRLLPAGYLVELVLEITRS